MRSLDHVENAASAKLSGGSSGLGDVLDRLDAQADRNALARDAAQVIRRLLEQLSTTETDLIEADFSRYAHAVEIDRMKNHRAAMAATKGRER